MDTDINTKPITPTATTQRFLSMDVMRGIALCGILLMNMASFSHVNAFYINPYIFGEPSNSDFWIWAIQHFFADQKFYTLFSLLFGAGIMMLYQKGQDKNVSVAALHYRRVLILLAFGLIHAIFIWFGDILLTYAITALWVYLLARMDASTKLSLGSSLIAVLVIFYTLTYASLTMMTELEVLDLLFDFSPDVDSIYEHSVPFLTNYSAQLDYRLSTFIEDQININTSFAPFRIGGTMLIGMALYQLKIITAERSTAFYYKLFINTFTIGSLLMAYDFYQLNQAEFSVLSLFLSSLILNDLAGLFIGISYIALIALWCRSSQSQEPTQPSFLQKLFANTGRMAFTMYIMQSLIATSIFYRFSEHLGMGYFGSLNRLELLLIACAIFIVQVLFATYWLRYFRFGPLEWLWKSLSYGKIQPMRR